MNKFELYDRVKLVKTTDPVLDGQPATVVGYHGQDAIVLFDGKPQNYNRAMVITVQCLERA